MHPPRRTADPSFRFFLWCRRPLRSLLFLHPPLVCDGVRLLLILSLLCAPSRIRGCPQVDALDLYGSVALPKHHQQDEVTEIYRFAAVTKGLFVNLALQEPFGLTLIEAAAHGLPSVATKNGGPVDIAATLKNGVLVCISSCCFAASHCLCPWPFLHLPCCDSCAGRSS